MKTLKPLLVLLPLLFSWTLFAHAPKSVDIKYNPESGKLSLAIVHGVKDVNDHFIKSVVISVNGKEVKTEEFKSQTSKEKEDAEILLADIKSGSEITVKANCSKFGSKSGSIKIQ